MKLASCVRFKSLWARPNFMSWFFSVISFTASGILSIGVVVVDGFWFVVL